jgi:hypothetical protein
MGGLPHRGKDGGERVRERSRRIMPEPKTLLDLYGLLVADGNKSFSDAIDRLMRKEVELGATDLDKVQDRLTTQLVDSISRTESVENREITGMDDTSKARANLSHAKEQQQERAAAFLAATMAAGLQQRQTRRQMQDSDREKMQKPRQPRL